MSNITTTANSYSLTRMDSVPIQYIVETKEGKFIRYAGLQYLADLMGSFKSRTNIYMLNSTICVVECEGYIVPNKDYLIQMGYVDSKGNPDWNNPCVSALMTPSKFYGSGSVENLKEYMLKYKIEMAETRSVVRCLRSLTGCPLTSLEELSMEEGLKVHSGTEMAKNAKERVLPTTGDRQGTINYINDSRSINGVTGIINEFLDSRDAVILENLSDDDLKTLCSLLE